MDRFGSVVGVGHRQAAKLTVYFCGETPFNPSMNSIRDVEGLEQKKCDTPIDDQSRKEPTQGALHQRTAQ